MIATNDIDPWYVENLVCPVDQLALNYSDGCLLSAAGRKYPVVDGVPVMLMETVEQTMDLVLKSLDRARGEGVADQRNPDLYLESLGITEAEKELAAGLAAQGNAPVDPVVSAIVGATSGYSYRHLIGKLQEYPIPELRLPPSSGDMFLDIGCNWGRWSMAAARKGYMTVGIDPSLGAVMAARRVARKHRLPIKYVVADARFLPFKKASLDVAFSYSVLQHLSRENVTLVLSAIARCLKPGGQSLIQMSNALGIRSLQNQMRRGFREPHRFEIRYWSVPEIRAKFTRAIGQSTIFVDCYFGLGLQKSDRALMPAKIRWLIDLSDLLRNLSKRFQPLVYVADSVYVLSTRSSSTD